MPSVTQHLTAFKNELKNHNIDLVVVSKGQSVESIAEAYQAGHRDFGENRVQELVEKYKQLPKDIRWHMIGHVQKNKVKYIAPFVAMIQSVDSMELLQMINNEGQKNDHVIECLLQVKIAEEETKYGFSFKKAEDAIASLQQDRGYQFVHVQGFMGMASNTANQKQIQMEFRSLKLFFNKIKNNNFPNDPSFSILSMGMSSDWHIAIEVGSTMLRIGRALYTDEKK